MALDKKKKKKVSLDGLSTKEKMLARKKQLESKGNGNGLVFPKEGTLRMRIKSPGDDQELGIEIVQFYLCLLYTSDAADDLTRVDLGGRRII